MDALYMAIGIIALAAAAFALGLMCALGMHLIRAWRQSGAWPGSSEERGMNAGQWAFWVRRRYETLISREDVLWTREQYRLGSRLRRAQERLRTLPDRIAACEEELTEVDEPWMDTVLEAELKRLRAHDPADILSGIWELQADMSEMELPKHPPHYEIPRIQADLCGQAIARTA